MIEFVEILQDLLDDNNLTLRKLSEKIGVPFQVLYAYKQKSFYPNIETAVKIADFFNCSLDYLFGLNDKRGDGKVKGANLSVFYQRYINLLKKNKVSHYRLYKTIGLNNSSITKWKNGATPKVESLIKIADYFGVSIDYLVGRTD